MKPKKKNPLSNPKSPESRIRRLELCLFELSHAGEGVLFCQSYSYLKRLDEALGDAAKVLPNKPTKPS